MEFHLGGEGGVAPRGELRVERGDQRVAGDAHGGGSGIEEAVVVGVGGVDLVAGELGRDGAQGFRGREGMVEGEGLGEGADGGNVEGGRDGERFDGAEVGLDFGDEGGPEGGAGGLVEEEDKSKGWD